MKAEAGGFNVKLFAKITGLIVVLQLMYAFAVIGILGLPENAGIFGDLFGGLNALFAGLAFAAVVVTIRQQAADGEANSRRLEEQIDLLRKDVALQQRAFRTEAAPFFEVVSEMRSADKLDLKLKNVGGAFLCRGFEATTKGCSVQDFYPRAVAPHAVFHAPTQFTSPFPDTGIEFSLMYTDRYGDFRRMLIVVRPDRGAVFWEVDPKNPKQPL